VDAGVPVVRAIRCLPHRFLACTKASIVVVIEGAVTRHT